MRYKGLSFLLVGLILVSIFSSYISSIMCVASELKEEVEVIQDQEEDRIEIIDDQVEDQQEEEDILTDSYVKLGSLEDQEEDQEEVQEEDKEVYQDENNSFNEIVLDDSTINPKRLMKSRSLINTYSSNAPWLFDTSYYAVPLRYKLVDGSTVYHDVLIFQKEKKPDLELISIIPERYDIWFLLNAPNIDYYIVYQDSNTDKKDLLTVVKNYLDNYGYPDSSCYWEAPEPTGEPTPTITPTVTPTPTGVPEQMPDDNRDSFRIMVIFCFGLVAGVVVGHFLSGFIK